MSGLYNHVRTLSRALYAEPKGIGAIADAFYNHVVEALDLGALDALEQELWSVLDSAGIDDETGAISSKIVRDAIIRLADDPMRHISTVPYGITKAEAKAAAFDDGCPFCVLEAARPAPSPEDEHVEGDCDCCDMLAREWRAEHADALARAGLAPPSHARTAPS